MIADGLRALIESVPDGFFVHDADGRFVDVNGRSCADLGYSREELLALTINDISCGANLEENARKWANAPAGMAVTFQEIAVRKNGSTYPVEISLTCEMIGGRKLFVGLARDITEREASQKAIEKLNSELELRVDQRTSELREAREKLQSVMDSAHDAILFQDRAGHFLVLNSSAERLSGISQAQALGKTVIDIFGPEIGGRLRAQEESVLASGEARTVEEVLPLAAGVKTFLITRSVHRDKQGMVTGLVSVARDVTDLKAAEQRMRHEHARLTLAASVGGLGIWEYEFAPDLLSCDEQWHRIMGQDPGKPIRSLAEFRPFVHPNDVERVTEVGETVARLMAIGKDYSITFRILRPDGEARWVRSSATLVDDLNGAPARAIGFVVDITEAHRAEEALEKQALEDPLTGIANRRRLDQDLDRACRHAARARDPLALAMIDVDFFKAYNDHYGHAQGDAALRAIAGILSSVARRPYDLAARYGGEEFVLLLPGTLRPEPLFEEISLRLAALRLPNARSPVDPCLTLSCGCAVVSDPVALRPTDILAQSDRALYRAKEAGRNRLVVVEM